MQTPSENQDAGAYARELEFARLTSRGLSSYRTEHEFVHYAEFSSVEEYRALLGIAKEKRLDVYIHGNGSNTLFSRKRVKTAILHNCMPRTFEPVGDDTYRVSTSVQVSQVLKYCGEHGLDSFYYLASVPATIGGALAMNAGRGRVHAKTIYDYVTQITYCDDDRLVTKSRSELTLAHRKSMFTGVQDRLIVECVMRFPQGSQSENGIRERIEWSKEKQDLSTPNCGTVFKSCSLRIMKSLRGFGLSGAMYSPKTANWLLNRSKSPMPLVALIAIAKTLHRITFRKAELELIKVR